MTAVAMLRGLLSEAFFLDGYRIVSAGAGRHTVEKREDGRERYANYVLATLQNPFEIWLAAYDDGSYRKRYIGVFSPASDLLVMLRKNRDGSLYWELYNLMNAAAKRLNSLRQGVLLYGSEVE